MYFSDHGTCCVWKSLFGKEFKVYEHILDIIILLIIISKKLSR